jgi:hypothetical protein
MARDGSLNGPLVGRLEVALIALGVVSWGAVLLHFWRLISLADGVELSLYGLYGLAAAAGWLAGNVYLRRPRLEPARLRRRLLLGAYLFSPTGLVSLLRAMAPAEAQAAAPLAWLYACGVYLVLFAVPVSLARVAVQRRRP